MSTRLLRLIPCLSLVLTAFSAEGETIIAEFNRYDRDHSGGLNLDEFLIGSGVTDLATAGRAGQECARMDSNSDGTVSLGEWVAYRHRQQGGGAVAAAPAVVVQAAPVAPASAAKPVAAPKPSVAPVPKPAVASAPQPSVAATTGGDEDEKDEVDPNLARGVELQPWTDNQRRSIENTFLPSAATVQAHHFHYRIVHVAREVWYEDTTTNFLGLDDSVKIGLQLGYGITDKLDVNVTRSNGRTLQLPGRPVNMDYWDVLFKYRLFDQTNGDLADVSVVAGGTVMLRNHGKADLSLDTQLVIERNLLSDRIRVGVGLARAGLSSYETINGLGPSTKLLPDEYDAAHTADVPDKSTMAIPFTVKVALTERWQVFGECIAPIAGYRTGAGPSTALGARFNTHTHEYSFYFANTANTAFNTVITGGADRMTNLPVFGFSIVAHL